MMVGTAYFVFQPNARLRQLLRGAPDNVVAVLEEPTIMLAPNAEDPVDPETIRAAKIIFVANTLAITLSGEEVSSTFGTLAATGDDFDKWWTCEAFSHDVSLAEIATDLRDLGALDALDPVVNRLLRHVTPANQP